MCISFLPFALLQWDEVIHHLFYLTYSKNL